jgi:hypothetical protein
MSAEQRAATAFNAIAIICVLLPAPWHWRTKNIGTLLFIFWATIGALVTFVNGIVWSDNVDNPSPVWCDVSFQPLLLPLRLFYQTLPVYSTVRCAQIAIRLSIGSVTGGLCGVLCITRSLYLIMAGKHGSMTDRQLRWRRVGYTAFGLGFPVFIMAVLIVVQPNRFIILEGSGCQAPIWWSWPGLLLVLIWPLVLSFASAVHSGKLSSRLRGSLPVLTQNKRSYRGYLVDQATSTTLPSSIQQPKFPFIRPLLPVVRFRNTGCPVLSSSAGVDHVD